MSNSSSPLRHLRVINLPRTCCALPTKGAGTLLLTEHRRQAHYHLTITFHLILSIFYPWGVKSPVQEHGFRLDCCTALHTVRLSVAFSLGQQSAKYNTVSFLLSTGYSSFYSWPSRTIMTTLLEKRKCCTATGCFELPFVWKIIKGKNGRTEKLFESRQIIFLNKYSCLAR